MCGSTSTAYSQTAQQCLQLQLTPASQAGIPYYWSTTRSEGTLVKRTSGRPKEYFQCAAVEEPPFKKKTTTVDRILGEEDCSGESVSTEGNTYLVECPIKRPDNRLRL